jgi:hypothetical protein
MDEFAPKIFVMASRSRLHAFDMTCSVVIFEYACAAGGKLLNKSRFVLKAERMNSKLHYCSTAAACLPHFPLISNIISREI